MCNERNPGSSGHICPFIQVTTISAKQQGMAARICLYMLYFLCLCSCSFGGTKDAFHHDGSYVHNKPNGHCQKFSGP